MKIVVALGGNALVRRGEPAEAAVQRRNVAVAADAVATLAGAHRVVVTHGNGPQVGLLALQAEAYAAAVAPYPLDMLGAASQGLIGYLIEQALGDRLPDRAVASLLTRVVVDPDDPAFAQPTKPIGPLYDAAEATRLTAVRGWRMASDGDGQRRVVASPEPRRILGVPAIARLLEAGTLVICAGGGGVPVVETPAGVQRGVEAVIDKDLTSALLAAQLGAEALLLLTDVPAVQDGWRTPQARPIREAAPGWLRRRGFAPGSMGPKVEAACRFAEATGGLAAIGALADAAEILAGTTGTRVRTGSPDVDYR